MELKVFNSLMVKILKHQNNGGQCMKRSQQVCQLDSLMTELGFNFDLLFHRGLPSLSAL